ncbi:hypothetical protein HAX54_019080 [Datura stramonium]|uniref:Aminotransferase-like plant mobile domain-containing protein n=1 Tax=Datura stramonium TaxID=4076 RepID=A0ABS8UQQ8_DATST|nr:hypothetical protein [Datura stramonium]
MQTHFSSIFTDVVLQAPHHRYTNIASALLSLGYWEWVEDTLSRSKNDAFYASLFTYDQNSDISQAFCERYIPQVCEYLFTAFHYLQESKTDSSRVSLSKWIGFWYKKVLKYEPAPPRREKKTARLKSMHNPIGAIPEDEEGVFYKLGMRPVKKEETNPATFLSYRLCAFMLPSEEGNFIQPETFKIATMIATKWKISLAVPVLASIYSSLSKVSRLSQLHLVRVRFPIHYVYSWLTHHFKIHYALANEPSNPSMVAFLGEGVARYLDKKEARNASIKEIT